MTDSGQSLHGLKRRLLMLNPNRSIDRVPFIWRRRYFFVRFRSSMHKLSDAVNKINKKAVLTTNTADICRHVVVR